MGTLERAAVTAIVASLLALLPGSPAGAATIRGKVVGGAGYVIAGTAPAGDAVTQRLDTDGSFALVFPGTQARGVSLQLIRPDGRYLGPVVLRHRRGHAYLTLAGRTVNLHAIVLGDGFAHAKRPAPHRAVDFRRAASADADGRPIGAGRLGLVAPRAGGVRRVRRAESGADPGPGEDTDGDGIVNAFDADDDGDLVLDGADPEGGSRSGGLFSTFFVQDLTQSLNVNVGDVSLAAIDALLRDHLNLVFYFDDAEFADRTITSVDVDCFTLPYCAPGTGTGIMTGVSESSPDLPRGQPWIDYDPNGDGFPNLEPIVNGGRPVHAASIVPGVTTAGIAAGDAFAVVVTTATGTITLPRSLPPYFVTTPAVVTYDAGAGPQDVIYPVAPGAPGTGSNPITLTGDRLTLTFYRPQRPAIAGAESGDYVDMGHLHYGIPLDAGGHEVACAGDYSDLSPTLSAAPAGPDFAFQLFPLTDSVDDAAPGTGGTLSFTIDLGSCLRRAAVDPTGMTLSLGLTATGESRPGGVDRTAQFLTVRMP